MAISVEDCDSTFDDGTLFNPVEPSCKQTLDLTKPYDSMVARELLRLANKRNGCRYAMLKHTPYHPKVSKLPTFCTWLTRSVNYPPFVRG